MRRTAKLSAERTLDRAALQFQLAAMSWLDTYAAPRKTRTQRRQLRLAEGSLLLATSALRRELEEAAAALFPGPVTLEEAAEARMAVGLAPAYQVEAIEP